MSQYLNTLITCEPGQTAEELLREPIAKVEYGGKAPMRSWNPPLWLFMCMSQAEQQRIVATHDAIREHWAKRLEEEQVKPTTPAHKSFEGGLIVNIPPKNGK